MATKHESRYEITRLTITIPKPFPAVLQRLQSSIVQQSDTPALEILKHLSSVEDYESAVKPNVGPHGFMQFVELKHGPWMQLYDVHVGKQATRIVFGNPLIAITMLKHDVQAGLFVPVEAYLVEREDGKGTDVIYIKPSTLIAGEAGADEKLKSAAEVLDGKLEALWDWVAADE